MNIFNTKANLRLKTMRLLKGHYDLDMGGNKKLRPRKYHHNRRQTMISLLRRSFAGSMAAIMFGTLVLAVIFAVPTANAANTAGGVAYGDGTTNVPKYRAWSGTDFASQTSAGTTAANVQYSLMREAPLRDEKILGTQASTGAIHAQIYNGSSWSIGTNAPAGGLMGSVGGNDAYRGFDMAYESSSSEFMMVFENSVTNDNAVAYRTYDGTQWSNEQSLSIPTGVVGRVRWLRLEPMTGTDKIMLVTLDSNSDLYALVWDGTAWGNGQLLTAAGSTAVYDNFDIAWEQISGEAMVVYGTGTTTDYWTFTGGNTWTDGTGVGSTCSVTAANTTGCININGAVQQVRLESSKTTNYIALSISDSNDDISSQIWDGSQWLGIPTAQTSWEDPTMAGAPALRTQMSDIAWEARGNRFLFGYIDAKGKSIRYYFYDLDLNGWRGNNGTTAITSIVSAGGNGGTWTGEMQVFHFDANPRDTYQIMMTGLDKNKHLRGYTWNGTAFIAPANSQITTTMSFSTFDPFYFVWDKPSPPTVNQSAYRWFENTTSTAVDWWNTSWRSRRKVTINNTASGSTLTDFPLLVTLTSSQIDYSKTQNSGQDIRFLSSDNNTELKYEIEKWDESGTSYVWVKIPSLTANLNSEYIYMYYDNATVADGQLPSDVWDNDFKMVHHFKSSFTCPVDIPESTINQHSLSCGDAPTSTSSGKVGNAVNFDGSNDYMYAPDNTDFLPSNGPFTMSGWVYTTSISAQTVVDHVDTISPFPGYNLSLNYASGTCAAGKLCMYDGTSWTGQTHGISTSTWKHVTLVKNGTTATFYVDGTSIGSTTVNGTIDDAYVDFRLGLTNDGLRPFAGRMDEFRFSLTNRSADWVKQEFNTVNNNMNSFGSEETWWSAQWAARRRITFNNATSGSNLTNFPVLVVLNSSNFNYAKSQDNGEDLRFIDDNGTTVLNYQVEKWDESGNSYIWVNVPQINASSNTDFIWLYYNNRSATAGANNSATWNSSYAAVWHMNNNPAGAAPQILDTTTNGNNGTTSGVMTSIDSQTAQIGNGLRFDGSNDQVDVTYAASLQPSNFTLQAWVKLNATSTADCGHYDIYDKGKLSNNGYFGLRVMDSNTATCSPTGNKRGAVSVRFSDGTTTHLTGTTNLSTGSLYHITATYDGTTLRLYLNGVQENSVVLSKTIGTNTAKATMGSSDDKNYYLNGIVDELRLSNIASSADWVLAQYKSMAQTFNTIGSEEISAVATPLADQDTQGASQGEGVPFRLRLNIHVLTSFMDPGTIQFKLQVSPRSGTCDTSFSGETYADVTTNSGYIRYYDNSNRSDASPITDNPFDPVHSGHTNIMQTYEESNLFGVTSSTSTNEDGLWEFALVDSSAPANTYYCFRAIKSDGSLLDSYSQIPELRVPPPNISQSNYRVYKNQDNTLPGGVLAAQNTNARIESTVAAFRLRMLLHIENKSLPVSLQNFKLQFAKRVDTCDVSFAGETYTDVATSGGEISYYDNVTTGEESLITATLNDPNVSGQTNRPQTYEESNTFTNAQQSIDIGENGLWDFVLKANNPAGGYAYCFRVVKSDGNLLAGYDRIAEITIPPTTDQQMRNGAWFSGAGVKQPYYRHGR